MLVAVIDEDIDDEGQGAGSLLQKRASAVTAAGWCYDVDPRAVALLLRSQPSVLEHYNPAQVQGDGNCLFRSVSVALYGVESYYHNFRLLTAEEIRSFPEWYDAYGPEGLHPLKHVQTVKLGKLDEVIQEVETAGSSCGVTAVLALSSVIGRPIHLFWPPLRGSLEQSPLTRDLVGRGVDPSRHPVNIMWSTVGEVPAEGEVVINHFVPLIKKGQVKAKARAGAAGPKDRAEPKETAVGCKRVLDLTDSDKEDWVCESEPKRVCSSGNAVVRFMDANKLYAFLTVGATVHKEVPKGLKENVSYLVDNSSNVSRQQNGGKNVFWDDCGAWNSRDGRNLTAHYVKDGSALRNVNVQDGQVCKKKTVNGKRIWVPVEEQPSSDDIVTISSYYATLKADKSYRKRVSWLVMQPNIAVYEYQGTPPAVNAEHGLARKTQVEFVRTKPSVLEKIRAGLKEKRAQARDVYEQMTLANTTDERPRDHKQVRNQAQELETGQRKKGVNVADDVQGVIQSVQSHPFVKEVSVRHGLSPVVICYTDEQVRDLKRFCSVKTPSYLRTVLGVDRTFNLGPCYVTVSVYRNLSVVRKSSSDNPIFIGPVMFHFDGRAETYRRFFSMLSDLFAGDVLCAEFAGDVELVFGSDEEKAMVRAMRQVFPSAEHIFCARHLEENVRRYLTDVAGMSTREREQVLDRVKEATRVDCDRTVDRETALTAMMATVRATATSTNVPEKVLAYFEDRILPKLRNNMKVMKDNGWVARHWTNNAAESINHVLKLKADWRQQPLSSCVDNVYDLVKLQSVELKSALTGRGNFTLVSAFSRHVVPYQVWATVSEEKKAELFERFLRDTGVRVQERTVTSQDGGLTLPSTPKVARKPGSRNRPRKDRTSTVRLKPVKE